MLFSLEKIGVVRDEIFDVFIQTNADALNVIAIPNVLTLNLPLTRGYIKFSLLRAVA